MLLPCAWGNFKNLKLWGSKSCMGFDLNTEVRGVIHEDKGWPEATEARGNLREEAWGIRIFLLEENSTDGGSQELFSL